MARLTYPTEAWRLWHADILARIDQLTPADVVASWEAMAAPSYQILGFPPSAEAVASTPMHTYLLRDGTWWARDPDATSMAARPGISWDASGPFLRLPTGEVVRGRDRAEREIKGVGHRGARPGSLDPTVEAILASFRTGRRDGSRKTSSAEILSRALVCLSLTDSGTSHLGACRTWLTWECQRIEPPPETELCRILSANTKVDLADRQYLKEHLRHIAEVNRDTWAALGLKPNKRHL